MIIEAVIVNPSVTIEALTENVTVNVTAEIINPVIEITGLMDAAVPFSFREQVEEIEGGLQNHIANTEQSILNIETNYGNHDTDFKSEINTFLSF